MEIAKPQLTTFKYAIFFVSLFFAVLIYFTTSNFAHADAPIGGGGNIGVGVGGGSPPATGVGTDTPDTPRPPGSTKGYQVEIPGAIYSVGCSNWNGAGSWALSTNCNVSEAAAIAAAPRPLDWGTYFNGRTQVPTYTFVVSKNASCGPSGNKSAYGQSWRKTTISFTTTVTKWRWTKIGGWQRYVASTGVTGESPHLWKIGCLYPATQNSSVVCFWNYGGHSWYSLDRNKASIAWENFGPNNGVRTALSSDPRAPTGGSGSTAPSCDRTGTANVSNVLPVDKFGYYSIFVDYNYKKYNNVKYVAWGNQVVYSNWTSGAKQYNSAKTWWTYSCQVGSTSSVKGPYNSQASIPNVDANLNPATCPQVNWQCKIDTPTIVGLDKTAVSNGTLSPTSPVSVLRNGEQVPLTFSLVKIVDTSTASDIDVTNGGTSPGVRNVTSIKYTNLVKAGSTPFVGTDPNASNQYFKLYKKTGTTTVEKFNTWYDKANTNVDKPIAFYWASDSVSAPFAVQRQWKVTAEFLVPQGGSVGGAGSPADVGMKWKVGTYDCKDYAGRGASRIDKGILTATSNPVQVVRSAGSGK